MKKLLNVFLLLSCLLPLSSEAQNASNPSPAQILNMTVSHPGRRSHAQVLGDEGECYSAAKKQTGIDPLNPPPRPEEQSPKKNALGTAAPIAVSAATHSPIGLAVSAGRRRRAANQNAQAQMTYDESWQQSMNAIRHAFATCMQAKSYVVEE